MKKLEKSKSSLKSVLTPHQRQEFTLCMLKDVLSAVKNAKTVAGVIVVSPDDRALAVARSMGAIAVYDPDIGLNGALKIAIDRAKVLGAESVLVLPTDLPLLKPADVEAITELASRDRDIVIARSRSGGTNALLLRPPDVIDLHFGGESFVSHVEEAKRAGIVPHLYRSEGVATDIDEIQDLVKLCTLGLGTKSREFLMSLEEER
ncbi:MAG: 2-phospho-L-lactate guanylyltransferase [Hadesarchaea archaeon]|nr:2-phospho-L-lactate guanylyltransferase [Hadesarchaea archaeon]